MPGTLHRYQTTGHDEYQLFQIESFYRSSVGYMQFAMLHYKYAVFLISIPQLYRFVNNDVYHDYASHLVH